MSFGDNSTTNRNHGKGNHLTGVMRYRPEHPQLRLKEMDSFLWGIIIMASWLIFNDYPKTPVSVSSLSIVVVISANAVTALG
jgi:hypothetical protein